MFKLTEFRERMDDAREFLEEKLILFNNGKKYGQVVFLAGGAGCYPKGTEFFTPTGWKNIENYVPGDEVLQFNPLSDKTNFTHPEEFVNLPVDKFTTIKNRCVDFTTSQFHKHILISEKTGEYITTKTHEFVEKHNQLGRGNKAKLLTTFSYSGTGVVDSDDMIRLRVAIYADGHILPTKEPKVRMSFSKDRKIVRFRDLLFLNDITFKEYTENGFTRFEFKFDSKDKEFGVDWYNCTKHQLKIVCDESLKWDGSIVDRGDRQFARSFSTTSKASCDFIQFAFSATGNHATICEDIREGKTTAFSVNIAYSHGVGVSVNDRAKSTTEVLDYVAEDGRMYCFTVPTGYFVVRQNGKIYVSGNSGKGFAAQQFMEADKFKIRDIDEMKLAFIKLGKLKKKYPEIRDLNLKVPADVGKLHAFVAAKGIKDRTLGLLLANKDVRRLPNIIFDITAKDLKSITKVLPLLSEAGYNASDIHVLWVLTSYEVAASNNAGRDRVVPDDILMQTHTGAAQTMDKVIVKQALPRSAIDGGIYVVLNNRENTITWKETDKPTSSKDARAASTENDTRSDEEKKKDVTLASNAKSAKKKGGTKFTVKSFSYLTIKKPRKAVSNHKDIMAQLKAWVDANAPTGWDKV